MILDINLRDAFRAHDRGDLELAESLYKKFLIKNPFHLDALFNLSVLLMTVNQPEQSIVYLKKSRMYCQDEEKSFLLLLYLGKAYLLNTQLEDARNSYAEALRLKPLSFEINFELGRAYFRMANYEQSICYLEQALKLCQGDKSYLLFNLAENYLFLNDYKTAASFYSQGMKIVKQMASIPDISKLSEYECYVLCCAFHACINQSESQVSMLKKLLKHHPEEKCLKYWYEFFRKA